MAFARATLLYRVGGREGVQTCCAAYGPAYDLAVYPTSEFPYPAVYGGPTRTIPTSRFDKYISFEVLLMLKKNLFVHKHK